MSTVPGDPTPILPPVVPPIDYDALVTEDHQPVDRIFLEKLYRLLTRPLYASWPGPGEGRPFLVLVNVGWFYQARTPAVVPDCLLSLDVECPPDLQTKQGHSYYQWDMGKQPDVIIEVVSDRTGGEQTFKKNLYARLGVSYYAVYDPKKLLSAEPLQTYELSGGTYQPVAPGPWPTVGLGLRLWKGRFEGHEDTWLRWCDASGEIIPTGEEQAREAQEQAKEAQEQAREAQEQVKEAREQASQSARVAKEAEERARQSEERARRLEAELRRLRGEPPA